jgi:hypothetical protein
MKSSFLTSAALVAASGFVSYFVAAHRRATPASSVPADSSPVEPGGLRGPDGARLSGEIAALRAQVADLKAQSKTTPAAEATGAAGAPAPNLTIAERREQGEQRRREHLDGVAAAFQREGIEPAWSGTATNAIRNVFGAPDVHLDATRVDCRTTMCRVELPIAGSAEEQERIETASTQLLATVPVMVVDRGEDANGRPQMILYYSTSTPQPAAR